MVSDVSRSSTLPRIALLVILVVGGIAGASAADAPLIAISGFGDILYTNDRGAADKNSFAMGQAEVDLVASIKEVVYASVAVAYDADARHFGLGAFTLDYHLLGADGEHFRRGGGIRHSGVMAGQFDVPFGIDWQVLPSIDRRLVSTPLVIDNTHDSWNDIGIQGYLEADWITAVIFATNGWDYDATDLVSPAADDSAAVAGVFGKDAFGARVGLWPHRAVAIGGSFAYVAGQREGTAMSLLGADLQSSVGHFVIKGEFLAHTIDLGSGDALTNTGFYVQGLYDFAQFFLVARYGSFTPDAAGVKDLTRFSAGAGWRILAGSELRIEYQINGDDVPERLFLQLVAGF